MIQKPKIKNKTPPTRQTNKQKKRNYTFYKITQHKITLKRGLFVKKKKYINKFFFFIADNINSNDQKSTKTKYKIKDFCYFRNRMGEQNLKDMK